MNVTDLIASDAFTPYRGTDEAIASFPLRNGAVYFAYDTKKIYFDVNGERHVMSGDGVHFMYGEASKEDISLDAESNLYLFPRTFIKTEHFLIDDIIINIDGTFYRIRDIDETYAWCDKLLVAGSGGGGSEGPGGIAANLTLTTIKPFPAAYPYNRDITGQFKVFDSDGGTQGNLTIKYYDNQDSQTPRLVENIYFNVGEVFDVILKKADLKSGENYITVQAEVDGGKTKIKTFHINCVNFVFQPTSDWNPIALKNINSDIIFPYEIVAGEGSSIPNDLKVNVTYLLDNAYVQEEVVTSNLGAHTLNGLFANVKQGGHSLSVNATTVIGNVEVSLASLYYGIGLYTGITSGEEAVPIIWSPYNKTEEENYSIIDIPYNVYDPTRNDNTAIVDFYINNEWQQQVFVTYSPSEWVKPSFSISKYNPEAFNVFTIQSGSTVKDFQVYIKKNYAINLDATEGAGLYLNALGRSNLENSAKRATWPNEATNTFASLGIGEPVLSGFNWSNNGWITDPEEGACLRISNGASVTIPMTSMLSQDAAPRTYEFDFKVKNATDYSRLINDIQIRKTDKDGNELFDEYGAPDYDVVKEVSDGKGAFLTYYDKTNYRGFMLGTQEAFFSISKGEVVNVRYTDEQRVKVSIVVDSDGTFTKKYNENGNLTGEFVPLIYIYVNSVLSNIMTYGTGANFNAAVSEIVINSEYCDVDIYNIRVYPVALSYQQITQNWVGDAPNLEVRKARYSINQQIVKNNKIDYSLVHDAKIIPTLVIKTYKVDGVTEADDKLPYQKGNKKVVGIRFYDPENPEKSFHCQNVELDVQGTSSQGYPRRNYKLKTKEKIKSTNTAWKLPFRLEKWDGNESNKDFWYQDNIDGTTITEDIAKSMKLKKLDIGNGVKVTSFCLKADYMESSSTHNTQFANMIQEIANGSYKSFDFRHPLNKDFNLTDSYRTTVYGFPILVFWENAAGNIEFVGKYNFNLDKSATDAFGFSINEPNEYTPITNSHMVWGEDENGEDVLTEDTTERHSTLEEVAECWEFTQNQSGLGKFQCDESFYDVIPSTETDAGKLQIYRHFEPRYTYLDWDIKDLYDEYGNDVAQPNELLKQYSANFKVMWDWVHSTDTNYADSNVALPEQVVYKTLSTEYEEGINYYKPDVLEPAEIIEKLSFEYDKSIGENSSVIVADEDAFISFMQQAMNKTAFVDLVGSYTFNRKDDGKYYFQNSDGIEYEAIACGLQLPENFTKTNFNMKVERIWDGFSGNLREVFTHDTVRYRKAKFKNEFSLHFDLNYVTLYFIMTEFGLAYDSRQKNMMIATWGPTKESQGNYIWYPIFYDIDTLFGLNNSGHPSWDYDTDATLVRTNPETGVFEDTSIYSGAGSVLWMNFAGLFLETIKTAYRELRSANTLGLTTLERYYNINGSSKWSEIMKNIDSDYKYIAPATTGFTDQEGNWAITQTYFYCLQGDRLLNRSAFFRNRLNYLDSQWLGGAYNPSLTSGAQIKMRYNANDESKTSDNTTYPSGHPNAGELVSGLQAEASYDLKSYLSQFLSVIYDETATLPVKFTSGQSDSVHINPPSSIATRLDQGIPLSQQLAYIRGPEYISDLGDLSKKYLNEFDYSAARRLRSLQLGSLVDGYKNELLSQTPLLNSNIGDTTEKGLLKYMDLSNIPNLSGTLKLTGCHKIETFKAMGTNLTYIEFTNGNMLKTLYLPESVNNLELLQPLNLKGLIATTPTYENQPEGLYIENVTNKMDVDPKTDTSLTTTITTLNLQNTKLGLDSYRLLKFLYDVKEARYAERGTDSDGTPAEAPPGTTLAIKLTGVEWSPYIAVEPGSIFQEGIEYYELINGTQYERYIYDGDAWINKMNDGILYIKDPNIDTTIITNLDMLQHFIDMKNDPSLTVNNKKSLYRYTSTSTNEINPLEKILPPIEGRLHVNNDEEHKIDEFTLYNVFNKEYPNLEITANYVEPAHSVRFIEYDKDGVLHDLQWLKYPASSTNAPAQFSGNEPERLHYIFQGWAEDSDELRAKHSVIEDSDDYNQETGTGIKVIKTADLATEYPNVSGRLTLCAVYKIKGYTMSFMCDGQLFAETITHAGSPIVIPIGIPYRDDTDSSKYELTECNKFIGWHVADDTSEDITNLNAILADGPRTFYAKFKKVDVYENVLTEDKLNINIDSDGAYISLKPELGLKGKLCLPKTVTVNKTEYPVLGISAGKISDPTSNGFCQHTDIYAVFFEGTKDGTNRMTNFGNFAFYECASLFYIDIPDTLESMGTACFSGCSALAIDDLKNVVQIGDYCFANAAINENALSLQLRGSIKSYNTAPFVNSGWKTIYFGSMAYPITLLDIQATTNKALFGSSDSSVLHLQNLTITREASIDQTSIPVQSWIANYDAHIAQFSNLVTYLSV